MRVTGSALVLCTAVHREQVKRSSDGMFLPRIEGILETALKATECVFSLTDLFAHNIQRQLVIFDELHAGSVSRERVA
jgi:hypothetical protein